MAPGRERGASVETKTWPSAAVELFGVVRHDGRRALRSGLGVDAHDLYLRFVEPGEDVDRASVGGDA